MIFISQLLFVWFGASIIGIFVATLLAAVDLEHYIPFDGDIWLGPKSAAGAIFSATLILLWGWVCTIFNLPFWLPS